ncbi:hypothetical protein APHAL10511_003358 [Amanita phalloides]|nr:hypothetical protein APHAL10511_003358 [Amanita phalloides]
MYSFIVADLLRRAKNKSDAGGLARIAELDEDCWDPRARDAAKKTSKVEHAIKDLEKKIMKIGGSKLLTKVRSGRKQATR